MNKSDAVAFFGTKTKIAEVLGISCAAVSDWGELVPEKNAARLASASGGVLVYDFRVYDARKAARIAPDDAQ
jgi:hypothetical protein